jgi:tetratricopeptide (TPR) repeat protein
MADNCLKMKNYEGAEQHFKKAAAMRPVMFMPLYQIVKIYEQTGRTNEAIELATIIIDKEVKIPSHTITNIKIDMQRLINTIEIFKDEQAIEVKNIPEKEIQRQGDMSEIQTQSNDLPP